MLASVFATVVKAAPWWDADIIGVTEEEYRINQAEASLQIRAMYQGFVRANLARSISYIYPDFYAGLSLDTHGRLVIFIVEPSLEQARNHSSIGSLLEAGVQYTLVEFSYAELREAEAAMWDVVGERLVSRHERRLLRDWCRYTNYIRDNMTWGYVSLEHNRSVIGLYRYDEEMIARFRKYVYEAPMIMFVQGSWLSLSGGKGTILPTVVIVVLLAAVIVVVVIIIRKHKMKNTTPEC